jgi:hypothetical protein
LRHKEKYILEGLSRILKAEGYNVPVVIWLLERDWALEKGRKVPPLPVSKTVSSAIRQYTD